MSNLLEKRVETIIEALSMCRRVGKTHHMAKVAEKIAGTLICGTTHHAEEIAAHFRIPTVSVSQNLRGRSGPFVVDNFAVEVLLRELMLDREQLHKQIEVCEEMQRDLQQIVGTMYGLKERYRLQSEKQLRELNDLKKELANVRESRYQGAKEACGTSEGKSTPKD